MLSSSGFFKTILSLLVLILLLIIGGLEDKHLFEMNKQLQKDLSVKVQTERSVQITNK